MKVLHVIARVNPGGTARWLETLTAEQMAAGQEVVVATGHVQGDEVEDPGAATMPLVRLGRPSDRAAARPTMPAFAVWVLTTSGLRSPIRSRSSRRGPTVMALMGAAARESALVEFSPARMLADHTAAYERAVHERRN